MAVCNYASSNQSRPKIERTLERWTTEVRNSIEIRLQKVIKKQENRAVASALLLGNKAQLDKTTKVAFRNAGVSHTLALSGLHVGIIWGLVCTIFTVFKRNYKTKIAGIFLSCSIMFTYAFCTGMAPSVSRACIMLVVWKIGKYFCNARNKTDALYLAALIISLFNPMASLTPGFQLSFAAAAGIIFIYPVIKASIDVIMRCNKSSLSIKKIARYILDLSGISLSCQIATLPLILFYFGKTSGNFLISNIAVAPLVTFSIYSSVGSILLANIPLIGKLCIYISNVCLSLLRETVMFFGC